MHGVLLGVQKKPFFVYGSVLKARSSTYVILSVELIIAFLKLLQLLKSKECLAQYQNIFVIGKPMNFVLFCFILVSLYCMVFCQMSIFNTTHVLLGLYTFC